MTSRPASPRRTIAKPSRTLAGSLAGCGFLTIAGVGLATAWYFSSGNGGAQPGAALCSNYDIDPNTGSLRDKGRVPCGSLGARNGRLELVRDAFRNH